MSLQKIKTMYDMVKKLLERDAQLRDNDNLLVSKIWGYTLVDKGLKPSEHSITTFLQMYSSEELPQADVITRARRKVQQEHKELRGKLWDERHHEEKIVRENITTNIN